MTFRLFFAALILAAGLLMPQIPAARIAVDTFPMATAITPDKKLLLVLNGGQNPPSLSVIDIASAKEISRAAVPDAWLGLAVTKAGDKVYVGGGSRAAVYEFTLANGTLKPARVFPVVAEKDRKPQDFIGDVQLAPDGHLLYAADLYRDSVVVINPQSGLILSHIKTGRRPYRILFHPSGKSFYVSSWTDGSIGRYDTANGERTANVRVAPHTTDMVWLDGPVDEQPAIVARLFVSATYTNNVYVLGANESGDLSRLETISLARTARQPIGTTPSGLGLSADRKKLFVACSDSNAAAVIDVSGPRSVVEGFAATGEYPVEAFGLPDGRMGVLNGHDASVQLVDLSSAYASATSSYRDEQLDDAGIPAGNPVRPGGPIRHAVYIVKGTGAPESVMRAVAGIAPDYTERLAPNVIAGRRKLDDFEGSELTNVPPAGYLWTAAAQAGVSLRSYGFFVENRVKADSDGTQIANVYDPILAPVTDASYRGLDPSYSDSERAKEFASEVGDFEKAGAMPQLLLLRFTGNSDASVADIASAVAKSRFGNETAVFVVEVSARGAVASVLSPWTKLPLPEGPKYDELSALRTVEIILGLHPLTTLDAAAPPMFKLFSGAK